MPSVYLSVDLGGTSLRMALLSEQGELLAQQNISSDLVREGPELVKVLSQESELFRFRAEKIDSEIQGLALGIPGLVDCDQGIVRQSPHFPKWKNVALREPLQQGLPFPVFMENDANQAALGEAWKGAGENWRDFILLTLGTGIGGGIVLDGKIFHGPNGFAGEIGHTVIDCHGLPGALGSGGTLESLASQSGLRLQVEHLTTPILHLDPQSTDLPIKLFDLAKGCDAAALQIWRDFGSALGCGLASLTHAFGFTRFIVGGGLAAAWDFFGPGCEAETRRRSYPYIADQIEIRRAKLGGDAGLIGGVRLILDRNAA